MVLVGEVQMLGRQQGWGLRIGRAVFVYSVIADDNLLSSRTYNDIVHFHEQCSGKNFDVKIFNNEALKLELSFIMCKRNPHFSDQVESGGAIHLSNWMEFWHQSI